MAFAATERKAVGRTRKLPMGLVVLAMNCTVASTFPTVLPHDIDQRTVILNVSSNSPDSRVGAEEPTARDRARDQ